MVNTLPTSLINCFGCHPNGYTSRSQFALFFKPLVGTIWIYETCTQCNFNESYLGITCIACEDQNFLDGIPIRGFFPER